MSADPGRMTPPRWFWVLLALCLVALTLAAVVRLRYLALPSHPAVVDLWRNRDNQPMVPMEIRCTWAPCPPILPGVP
jgi:hypothetical protein